MTEAAFASTRPQLMLDGEPRPDLEQALGAMVVNLPLAGSAHAELQLSNWGVPEGGRAPDFVLDDIALGDHVSIAIGAGGDAVTLIEAEITAIEERYGDGAPTRVLLLQDALHRLARARHSRSFEDLSLNQVINTIAGDAGLQADVNVSALTGTWHQLNESSLAFMLRLLGRFDIAARLQDGALRARPEEADASPIRLDIQDSVLSARLIADLNHQATETRVSGFDAAHDEDTDHRVSRLDVPPHGDTAAGLLAQLGWPGPDIVPQPFARSAAEAEAWARAHFSRQAGRFVQGELRCQGEPGLRSGREVELEGVSPRLRGLYRIVHCVHRFDNTAGFETHLRVNRADWGGR